jgi:hypothetical protein
MLAEELHLELQEVADLLWLHAHGAPPLEEDPVRLALFADQTP